MGSERSSRSLSRAPSCSPTLRFGDDAGDHDHYGDDGDHCGDLYIMGAVCLCVCYVFSYFNYFGRWIFFKLFLNFLLEFFFWKYFQNYFFWKFFSKIFLKNFFFKFFFFNFFQKKICQIFFNFFLNFFFKIFFSQKLFLREGHGN